MNKIYLGGITEKTNQKGDKYYLMNVWCNASYNGIEGQRDNYYYIVDVEAYEAVKNIERDCEINAEIEVTENSTKLILNGKKYNQR